MKEASTEHPFFRVLVLMGGGLALSCGGTYSREGDAPTGDAGSASSAGSAGSSAAASGGGAISGTAGAAGTGGVAVNPLSCPSEQWDCSKVLGICYSGTSQVPPSGCVCDTSRPTSAAACAATDNFVCMQVYLGQYNNGTWDGSTHVQCMCVPSSVTDSDVACSQLCASMRSSVNMAGSLDECRRPSTQTCDASGNCTATAADVLRQDGIMCGCADISLK
jgi:hypothetical protein